MKLIKLEFIGFKSFYEKTKIDFHTNMNGIVGPNGCGKSNIIDAIKWVMGEQNPRNLRAVSMDELISNGGETLRPLGMAEVSIVISSENGSGLENINIKRRLFRTGTSEYYINDVPCRLKDIAEVFVDTGVGARAYSVISQGKVESIITSKPEGKREVIEEVAGIGKYKLRRKETQRRIESTRQNLNLVKESQAEILRQIKNLKKQAEDAENYKRIADEAENLEHKILIKNKNDLEALRRNNQIAKEEIKIKLDDRYKLLSDLKNKASDIRNRLSSIDHRIETTKDEVSDYTGQLHIIDSKIDINKREELSLDENVRKLILDKNSYNAEIEEIDNIINVRKYEHNSYNHEVESRQNEINRLELELDQFKNELLNNKSEYNKYREDLLKSLDEYSILKSKVVAFEQELRELNLRITRVSNEKADLYYNAVMTQSEININNERLQKVVSEQVSLITKNVAIDHKINSFTKSKENTESDKRKIEEQLNQTNSRLNVLRKIQNNYEWLPHELSNFIVEHKGDGIIGVLADFVTVPKEYEMALEAALGEKLKWSLVNDFESANRLINNLKSLQLGRGTFFPIKNQPVIDSVAKNTEGLVALKDVIEVVEINGSIINNILDKIYITNSLLDVNELEDKLCDGYAFVTLDGNYVDSSGYVSGGNFSDSVFGRKREIEELTEKSKLLDYELNASQTELHHITKTLSTLNTEISSYGIKLKQLEIFEAEIRKDIVNLTDRYLRYLERLKVVGFELSGYENDKSIKSNTLESLSHDITIVENNKHQLETGFKSLEIKLRELEESDEALKHELTQKKVEVASTKEKLKSIEQEIVYYNSRKNNLLLKILLNHTEIEKLNYSKSDIVKNMLELKVTKRGLEDNINYNKSIIQEHQNKKYELDLTSADLEKKLIDIESAIEELKAKSAEIELNLNSVNMEIKHINEKINIPLTNFQDEDLNFDIGETEGKLLQLKARLDRFGPVNLLAPEEYIKLDERNRFLTEQLDDLEESIVSLKKAISKIDRESKKRFVETFKLVNEKFKEVFPRIFKGGEGKLELSDPEDLLNTGVEVYVRPKGKKFQSINLLSGGEKALCAISLVLSACFIKPAPFLLLDEIDAPLDDNNTASFIEVIKEISNESQILLITHNKKTMLDVNYLIGITSEQPGTSKVVSVELH